MHKYNLKIDWEQETTKQNFLAPYTLSLMWSNTQFKPEKISITEEVHRLSGSDLNVHSSLV